MPVLLGIHQYHGDTFETKDNYFPPIALNNKGITTGADGLLPGYKITSQVAIKKLYLVYYLFINSQRQVYQYFGVSSGVYSQPFPILNSTADWIALLPPNPPSGYYAVNLIGLQTYNNLGLVFYEYSGRGWPVQESVVIDVKVYGEPAPKLADPNKPCYRHLITGFELDDRVFPTELRLTCNLGKEINIGYYCRNKVEKIPNLISIDWVSLKISLIANVPFFLDITDLVLGTLYLDTSLSLQTNGTIPYTSLLPSGLSDLFTYWNNLYKIQNPTNLNYFNETRKIRLCAANNNVWNNNTIIQSDINYDLTHPLFAVDNQRAYDWHIKPQTNNSVGTLIMDSPRVIEIHAALEASKYKAEVAAVIGTGTAENPQTPAIHTLGYSIANGGGQKLTEIHAALEAAKYKAEVPAVIGTGTADNPQTPAIHTLGYSIANGGGQKLTEIHKALDAGKYSKVEGSNIPRVATLGHLISKISAILGYRPEPDGSFTEDTEKKLVRKIVASTEKIDKKKIGVNNFGSDGMLLKRLNNRFNGDKIANDECVIVRDLPQLLAEYQDQINLALGLQESSAVEIKNNSEVSRYSNQLAMLSELLNLASSNHDMIRAALISSLIAQGQTSETIAALGLPTVTKTLPIDVDGKITHLPYKGVAPHRSISQEVATCTQNVGIVLGQLL
jgi:hypothetical protein